MVSLSTLREVALSYPEATEEPHFEKTSFRVNKKIFATYDFNNNRACVKLSELDQKVFSTSDGDNIYPVHNSWGTQGWTFIEMKTVRKDIFIDALTAAYCTVASKKLSERVKQRNIR